MRELIGMGDGRSAQLSTMMLDSRTLQRTPESGDWAVWDGGTGHLAVDTLAQLLTLHITPANTQDRGQVADLAAAGQEATGGTVRLAHVDKGSTGDAPRQAAADHDIALEVSTLPEATRGVVLVPRRWVVERGFGWMRRFRRLARDQERLADVVQGVHLVALTMTGAAHLECAPTSIPGSR